jgi:hypothetical protein
MTRALIRAGGAAALALSLIVLLAGPAAAHEERTVGRYDFAVGFGDEPAYAGLKNSVQMLLHYASSGKPVVNLGNTLDVQIAYGSKRMPRLSMEPDFEVGESGTPGDYRGWFIPTRPGRYSFHFTGSVLGQRVNETFKSGVATFSNVQDPQGVEFPAKDPTIGQLNDRLDREIPRVNGHISAARAELSDATTTARNLAIAGVVIGLIALAVALFGPFRKSG